MTKPHRALCAELTAALNDWQWETGDDRYAALIARARAALAQPELPPSYIDAEHTDLSPAAQAVLDAFTGNDTIHGLHLMTPRLAAVLRAAAGCVPKEEWGGENYATGFRDGIAFSCQFLHELAAELEVEA